jgi:hypothetical protein
MRGLSIGFDQDLGEVWRKRSVYNCLLQTLEIKGPATQDSIRLHIVHRSLYINFFILRSRLVLVVEVAEFQCLINDVLAIPWHSSSTSTRNAWTQYVWL